MESPDGRLCAFMDPLVCVILSYCVFASVCVTVCAGMHVCS